MIRTCPDFERYGIDDNGDIVSCCRGDWKKINPKKGILCLHGEKTTTCKIGKFRYCVDKQISPAKLSVVGAIITNDGNLWSKSDFRAEMNRSRKCGTIDNRQKNIQRLQHTIDMAKAAIEYINGNPTSILSIVEFEKERIENSLFCNKTLAREIVAEAELQLFDALFHGNVTDPVRWLYKRSKGILLEQSKKIRRYSDELLLVN